MCIPSAKINMPETAALAQPPPPLPPPQKTADQLVVASSSGRRRARNQGETPDLEDLRIPLNIPRAGSAEGVNYS